MDTTNAPENKDRTGGASRGLDYGFGETKSGDGGSAPQRGQPVDGGDGSDQQGAPDVLVERETETTTSQTETVQEGGGAADSDSTR